MLRSKHSSSSSSPANHMDVTVLQRQRDLLQRLHQQSNSLLQNQEMECCRSHVQSALQHHTLQNQSYSVVSNSDCSSIRKPSEQGRQCNSSLLTREMKRASCSYGDKRKAEFDIDEENQENLVDYEEAGDEKSEITMKTEREASTNTRYKGCSKVQKTDFIHVRARRGQATDSHSLAERARREKISKKMKCLQDLVPGCNKVTGKAGMLDEIINYVQSLQKQVEFLSMKLATLNPRLDFGIENFFAKEAAADIGCLLPSQATAAAQFEPIFHYNTMQPYNPAADIAVDPSQTSPGKIGNQQLPVWELDWTSMFNAGFH